MKRRLLVVLCLLALLTGCGLITQPAPSPTLIPTPKPPPYAEYLGYFQQELLFIQQGLRQHDIDQTFTVYFAAPDFGKQRIALDDGEGVWEESFSFVYDKELRWFTFSELYEPVLTQNIAYRTDRDDWAEFLNTAIYKTELSADTELAVPIRFDMPKSPQESSISYSVHEDDRVWYEVVHYQYRDARLAADVEIVYPAITMRGPVAGWERFNEPIETAMFGANAGGEYWWTAAQYLHSTVHKNCDVTRADFQCFSTLTYTYGSVMGAPHPSESFFGMTFDVENACQLTLRDVIGSKTVEQLLDTGAFHCQMVFEAGPDAESHVAAEQMQIEDAKTYLDPDSTDNFYLTDDSLGLIGYVGSKSFCMEAPLSALGLSQWIQTDS